MWLCVALRKAVLSRNRVVKPSLSESLPTRQVANRKYDERPVCQLLVAHAVAGIVVAMAVLHNGGHGTS